MQHAGNKLPGLFQVVAPALPTCCAVVLKLRAQATLCSSRCMPPFRISVSVVAPLALIVLMKPASYLCFPKPHLLSQAAQACQRLGFRHLISLISSVLNRATQLRDVGGNAVCFAAKGQQAAKGQPKGEVASALHGQRTAMGQSLVCCPPCACVSSV